VRESALLFEGTPSRNTLWARSGKRERREEREGESGVWQEGRRGITAPCIGEKLRVLWQRKKMSGEKFSNQKK